MFALYTGGDLKSSGLIYFWVNLFETPPIVFTSPAAPHDLKLEIADFKHATNAPPLTARPKSGSILPSFRVG